ncbi:MAG: hypothetical protein IPK80_12000 [Nannocystis sp.]|nr:hypothetical protein [Nannocystis sp.]
MPLSTRRAALAAVALALALGGCDGSIEPPGPDAGLLRAVEGAGYRGWARPSQGVAAAPLFQGRSTHGDFLDVYLNPTLAEAAAAAPMSLSAWPDGSIVVLDGWDDPEGASLRFIAIMEKRAGAWYYESYLADDREAPRYHGAPDACIGCHAAGSDGLRTVTLP